MSTVLLATVCATYSPYTGTVLRVTSATTTAGGGPVCPGCWDAACSPLHPPPVRREQKSAIVEIVRPSSGTADGPILPSHTRRALPFIRGGILSEALCDVHTAPWCSSRWREQRNGGRARGRSCVGTQAFPFGGPAYRRECRTVFECPARPGSIGRTVAEEANDIVRATELRLGESSGALSSVPSEKPASCST